MIKQQIKLHVEPTPYKNYQPPVITEKEVQEAIETAKLKVKIGDIFCYKHNSPNKLIVIGFEENPEKVSFYKGEVAPIIMKNMQHNGINKFALSECFDSYLEPVVAPETSVC